MRTRRWAGAVLIVATLVPALGACGSSGNSTTSGTEPTSTSSAPRPTNPPTGNPTTADAAKAAWAAAGIDRYRFDFAPSCFCPDTNVRVEVRDGKVVDVKPLTAGGPVPKEVPTVDTLLAELERAVGEATGEVQTTYAANGVPLRASIDWIENAVDDEYAWKITNFEPVT